MLRLTELSLCVCFIMKTVLFKLKITLKNFLNEYRGCFFQAAFYFLRSFCVETKKLNLIFWRFMMTSLTFINISNYCTEQSALCVCVKQS